MQFRTLRFTRLRRARQATQICSRTAAHGAQLQQALDNRLAARALKSAIVILMLLGSVTYCCARVGDRDVEVEGP
jgi:hypothetical protein